MPRWTETIQDIQKVAGLAEFIEQWACQNARVTLSSGMSIDGIILPGTAKNNAGASGRWAYAAAIVLRLPNEDVEIDFLDVADVQPL